MHEAFESADFLIRQTEADMERFKDIFCRWIDQGYYIPFIEKDTKTGNHIHKVRFNSAVPEDLRAIANNVLNNIRHTFDQFVSAVYSIVNGIEAPDRFYFPFATNPNDLEGRLRQANFANFPEGALKAIRAVEPYPKGTAHMGGNDLFSTFCGAAGRNKHRTTANLDGFVKSYRGNGTTGLHVVSIAIPPVWNVAKGEMLVGITAPYGKLDSKFQIVPEITFGNAGKLTGAPIYDASLAILDIAKELINELDASCN